jgi:hypothetical protein
MNFPSDKYRGRMEFDRIGSDLKALSEQSKLNLPTIDQTARRLWKHNLRRSEEGSLMKVLHSLKSHPATTTVLGIVVVAAVLLAVPISYTKTTGYRATLEISDATGVDINAVAAEFGKVLDAEGVAVRAGAAGASITAALPVRAAGRLEAVASGFAEALGRKGIPATAEVERVTERVTGNVYAMAANGIIEIRVNSEGKTDEEIEAEIRAQIEAAGLEACLVDVQSNDGEKRIEIGIQQPVEEGCDGTSMPVRITIDGMEPPPGAECTTESCMELRIAAAGRTFEEVEAIARAQLEAMGIDATDIELEDCIDYYRVRVGSADACCPAGDTGTVLGNPKTESKTWGEIKKEFTE